MAGPTIVFIRHGETDWNREERFQGQRDIPLNALGRRQAERNGRAVAGILAAGDWRLIASPLGRTVETMQIALAAAGRAGASFTTDSRLKEASFGDWEGLTLTEITAGQPDFARQRELDKWGFVPPSGESYSMLAERIDGWVRNRGCADTRCRPRGRAAGAAASACRPALARRPASGRPAGPRHPLRQPGCPDDLTFDPAGGTPL
jgi:probable phosphoglycerate mutase